MSTKDLIDNQPEPITVARLQRDLANLGVESGMTLLVHSSLRSLGWVNGGAAAIILALEKTLTSSGTLVMPTHTNDLSDPSKWENPPVPEAWWETIRETMPPFDPTLTPTTGMGTIPETFRKQAGVLRSQHPQFSFAAWGQQATVITANQALPFGLGEQSPLARVYDLAGWVLLLGVGHLNNTSLHLAEYRADFPAKQTEMFGAPMLVDGQQQWLEYEDINLDEDDFDKIGAGFAQETGLQQEGKVGQAAALLMPQKPLVDYAVNWLPRHRPGKKK